ncbi:sigma-70 family RNA polymerase sigma factor [Gammaproteobacteria bacterium]|nr:sigma-70 family RNA polymerase sigma factor [Gammaproteobacteria bacterium]
MKDSNKNIDLNLVKRAKKGDYQAFDLLVIKYQTRLISTAFKFVKDMQIAEDIVQESLIKSYKSLHSFREDSSFYTWVYRITVNTAKNFLVSKKRRGELLQAEIGKEGAIEIEQFSLDSPEALLMRSQLKHLIENCLNQLSEETKTAISLREFDGLSYEEISKIVNCPVGTIRSRIFRGREILDKEIENYREENKQNIAKETS